MARVKRGNVSRNKHKKVLKLAKGFRGALSKLYRPAHQAVSHAMQYAFNDRRKRKRDFRGLWIARLNAALTLQNLSYSKFMGDLKKDNIQINRKMLAMMAVQEPEVMAQFIQTVKK